MYIPVYYVKIVTITCDNLWFTTEISECFYVQKGQTTDFCKRKKSKTF